MVQIQEQNDDVSAINDLHPKPQPSSSSTTMNTTTPSQQPHHSSHSSASSISSDHTFHGFSPPISPLPLPLPLPHPVQTVQTGRLIRDQPEVVTKIEPDAETGFAGVSKKPRRRTTVRREKSTAVAAAVLRFFEVVVCLVSFSVMAADKRRGWAVDSFDRYIEFRYSMTVNVIGFAYAGLQGLDLLLQLSTGKDPVRSKLRYCFDFAIDQILAYLLLSSSSSAFTRVDDWISNWGQDKFPAMASASVGVSFLAFIAFALSSLISGYTLSTHGHA
ncbi:hypothetical protein KSS87_019017 [Heliosperma pusillum]|nr:hypothetical protein KSS87_019017 [Heliosperma pusillum]